MRPCFSVLTDLQQDVLRLRAGLGPARPHSRPQTARVLDVSLRRVRRSERTAVRQLVSADRATGCGLGRLVSRGVGSAIATTAASALPGADLASARGWLGGDSGSPGGGPSGGRPGSSGADTPAGDPTDAGVAGVIATGEPSPVTPTADSDTYWVFLLVVLLAAATLVLVHLRRTGRLPALAAAAGVGGDLRGVARNAAAGALAAATGVVAGLRRRAGHAPRRSRRPRARRAGAARAPLAVPKSAGQRPKSPRPSTRKGAPAVQRPKNARSKGPRLAPGKPGAISGPKGRSAKTGSGPASKGPRVAGPGQRRAAVRPSGRPRGRLGDVLERLLRR